MVPLYHQFSWLKHQFWWLNIRIPNSQARWNILKHPHSHMFTIFSIFSILKHQHVSHSFPMSSWMHCFFRVPPFAKAHLWVGADDQRPAVLQCCSAMCRNKKHRIGQEISTICIHCFNACLHMYVYKCMHIYILHNHTLIVCFKQCCFYVVVRATII